MDDEKASSQPLEVYKSTRSFKRLRLTLGPVIKYFVTEAWSVPYVGTVVNGILNGGTLKTGDVVLIGPDANGNYQSTIVRSMQRKR